MTFRDVLGIVALDAVFLAVGFGVLFGIGMVRSWRAALRFAGLGLFLGWALLGVLASMALVAGAALTVWEVLLLALASVVAGAASSRRLPALALRTQVRERGPAAVGVVLSAGVLAVYLGDLLRASVVSVTTAWDANGFWIVKSAAIVEQNGLHTGDGQFASFFNPDYPPFAPVQDALTWRFTGSLHVGALPTQHWVIAVAFLAAAAGLVAGRIRPVVLWTGITVAALMPGFQSLIGSSLGDEPLAMLLALMALAGALWLVENEAQFLAVAAILGVAAAWTKVEGLPGALLVGVMLLLVGRLRSWRAVLPVIAAPVLFILPWRLWLHIHHITSSGAVPYARLLHPSYLWHARGRFGTGLAELPGYALNPGNWLLAIPVALLLALVLSGRRNRLAWYVAGIVVLAYVGNAAVYWISPIVPLREYIDTSAPRVVASITLTCALLCPLLFSLASEDDAGGSASVASQPLPE